MPGAASAVMVSPVAGAGAAVDNGLLADLWAYWPATEASGNLLDAHLYGNDFTDTNTVTTAAGNTYSAARQFTAASNERFVATANTYLHGGAYDFTISLWVYFDAVAAQQTLWQDGGASGLLSQVIFSTYKANRLTWIMFNSAGANAQAHADTYGDIPAATWLCVTVSYTAATGQMAIAINDGAANTVTLSGTPRVSVATIEQIIGYSGARPFGGRMGPIAMWKRVLSADDREAWYNSGRGLTYAQLTGNAPQTYLFALAGQSNMSGRGTNNQTWSHATLVPVSARNVGRWGVLTDPSDSTTGQIYAVSNDSPTVVSGSIAPLLATQIMATTGKAFGIVPCAKGGTSIADWQPGADPYDTNTLFGSMVTRTIAAAGKRGMDLAAVLFWQGEQDALAGTTQAAYNAALDTLAAAVHTYLSVPLVVCKLQNCSGAVPANLAAINAAIAEAWADNPDIVAGPDLSDLATDDDWHLKTDAKLLTAATRWHDAIIAGVTL